MYTPELSLKHNFVRLAQEQVQGKNNAVMIFPADALREFVPCLPSDIYPCDMPKAILGAIGIYDKIGDTNRAKYLTGVLLAHYEIV